MCAVIFGFNTASGSSVSEGILLNHSNTYKNRYLFEGNRTIKLLEIVGMKGRMEHCSGKGGRLFQDAHHRTEQCRKINLSGLSHDIFKYFLCTVQ